MNAKDVAAFRDIVRAGGAVFDRATHERIEVNSCDSQFVDVRAPEDAHLPPGFYTIMPWSTACRRFYAVDSRERGV